MISVHSPTRVMICNTSHDTLKVDHDKSSRIAIFKEYRRSASTEPPTVVQNVRACKHTQHDRILFELGSVLEGIEQPQGRLLSGACWEHRGDSSHNGLPGDYTLLRVGGGTDEEPWEETSTDCDAKHFEGECRCVAHWSGSLGEPVWVQMERIVVQMGCPSRFGSRDELTCHT